MLLILLVSLYTVRVVLEILGEVDYGIYNVVGGVVTMLSFLSGSMSSASQRFFSYEIGRNDLNRLKRIFSANIVIYSVIAFFTLIIAETLGVWFLNTQMNIPLERMEAAFWVLQFSILSFFFTIFRIPYNALIIAHENMKVYAYVSIVEVLLQLAIVYLLTIISFDKLKVYAFLVFCVTVIVTLIYYVFCRKKYKESSFSLSWDKCLFKEQVSYSGWNLFGASAKVMNDQGINIMLNVFFGPVVNTSRAIAFQVNRALNMFVLNFMTASRPQITKYYAVNEKALMFRLVFQISKLSFLLLFIISMSVLLETNFVLMIWLKEVPENVVLFSRLIIVNALIDSLSYPLMTAVQSTGRIKKYQIVVGGVMLFSLPISYAFLTIGYPPQTVFYVAIVISIVCLILRLYILNNMIGLPIEVYFRKVILPILYTIIIAYIFPYFFLMNMESGIVRFACVFFIGTFSSLISIYFIGLSKLEKQYVFRLLKNKYKGI